MPTIRLSRVLHFDPRLAHPTLLGFTNPSGSVRLPAILHIPGQGTLRITASGPKDDVLVGYAASREGRGT